MMYHTVTRVKAGPGDAPPPLRRTRMRTHHHSSHHAPRPHGPAASTEHHDELVDVLNRLAHAITSGDGRAAAQLWDAPGFLIGADTVMAVSDRDQLAAM